ncbi:MAG: hypothetical protein JO268_05640 [Pseudonocardiales bacterium]|nr:hypothetical protein [Pseudonocardiales bacterium]
MDTHGQVHVAAALGRVGRPPGYPEFPGYRSQVAGVAPPAGGLRGAGAWRLPAPAAPSRSGARPGPRPGDQLGDPTTATRIAMRATGRRVAEPDTEITTLDTDPTAPLTTTAPTLTGLEGTGIDTTGQPLVTAGDHPHRRHSEAALARLLGIAPLPTSSETLPRPRDLPRELGALRAPKTRSALTQRSIGR